MEDNLKQSILQTLAYFDIFDHPLTQDELFRYLYIGNTNFKLDYVDFTKQLQNGLSGIVEQDQGFYFLPGRKDIVQVRQSRVKLVEEKMKIAAKGIKKITQVPFVRAVFVCNTLGYGVVDEDSDIDVFIIVRQGRLFIARALATLYLSLFGLRRTKKKIKNKICLSFYVADNNLNLEKTAIDNDIYLVYWLNNLIPVYDPDNLHQKILQANNWASKYLANGLQNFSSSYHWSVNNYKISQTIKNFFEKAWGLMYGDLIESQAKAMQLVKMKMNFISVQNENDTRVIVNDEMLKFHENDRRQEYRDKWLEKCKQINNT